MADYEDIGFAQNYTNVLEIDTTPNASEPTWAWLAAGVSEITPEGNEVTDDTAYYDGEGGSSSDVTGGQLTFSVTGHRRYGDPAQDYIVSKALSYGEARKTNYRWTTTDGTVFEGKCTLADLVPNSGQGSANDKGAFSCTIRSNGTPKVTEADAKNLPDNITATVASTKVGETTEAKPKVTPATASQKCLFAIKDSTVATVDADGVITGVSVGETELTIKCAAKPSVNVTVDVKVTASQ